LIDIVRFRPEHLEQLVNPLKVSAEMIPLKNSSGGAYTALYNNKPVMSAGALMIWPHVAEGWALVTPLDPIPARKIIFEIRQRILGFMRSLELHRLQATVRVDEVNSNRFVRAIGFEFEGYMKGYDSDGNDFVRYGKVMK